ncbi:MAG: hypothetical protein E6I41_05055 [Chloroflexi bacterium]|nr:MAG: hypothetical protein E6I41_05055 [Chloroflexota bacterium]
MTADVRITRRATFAAGHILCREDWTDEKNREVFGACSRGVMPTAENVALAAFNRLEPHMKPARLLRVRVVETENNSAEVNAD